MYARKIATSVPGEQYVALEQARRRLHLRRSDAVQRALAMWLASQERDARVERYVRGYLEHPEDAAESRAFVRAWAKGLGSEEW